jgi:hypothetical protein
MTLPLRQYDASMVCAIKLARLRVMPSIRNLQPRKIMPTLAAWMA